VDLVVILDVDL